MQIGHVHDVLHGGELIEDALHDGGAVVVLAAVAFALFKVAKELWEAGERVLAAFATLLAAWVAPERAEDVSVEFGTAMLVVGLPSVIWFLFAATMAGGVLAWGLVSWHASHPKGGLPENQTVLR